MQISCKIFILKAKVYKKGWRMYAEVPLYYFTLSDYANKILDTQTV